MASDGVKKMIKQMPDAVPAKRQIFCKKEKGASGKAQKKAGRNNKPKKHTKQQQPSPGIGRKLIRFADTLIDKSVFLVCLILFLMGFYGLYDSYMVYQSTMDNSLLKYKPGYESDDSSPEKEIEGNMVAWLTLDDTKVDYPVMQGEDNTEYLNKDPYGDYALAGSIFLDSRNNSEFQDAYSLIYGHHMEQEMMFGALDRYLDEEYFRQHETGTLTVGDVPYHIQLFAVLECEATEKAIFAPAEVTRQETLAYIQEHALFLDDSVNTEEGNLLGMSTCKYPDTVERTLIFGILTPLET